MILKKNIHYILLFLFVSSTVFAASEAEYKKLSKTYTLHTDGSQEYRCYMELTLFTHTAMNRTYGESFIVYNSEYQELKIHSSYTKQKDGTIIKTPGNAFVEVLPRQAADAPAYNHLKEMVVVHTGLELGATIYLDYSVVSKPGYLPELDICEPIRQSSPVKEYTIKIAVPENKPLSYDLAINNVKPVVQTVNGEKQVTWKLKNLTPTSREPLSNGIQGDVLFFTASTYPSAKEVLNTLKKQFANKNNNTIKFLSESIVSGCTTEREKLLAILKYVSDDLSNSSLTIQETGFRVRPAEDVISSAYGTEAEKVNLLSGLLDAVDISNEVVVAFHPNISTTNCGLSAIEEFFVKANADGKTYYLTPEQNEMSEAVWYADYVNFISITNPGEKVRLMKPSSVIDYEYIIVVTADSASIGTSGKLGNAFLPYSNDYFKSYTENDEDAIEEVKSEYSIFSYSMSQPLKKKTGDYIIYPLSDILHSFSHTPYRNYNSKRMTNLLLPYIANESFKYSIRLSENIEPASPEVMKTISNPVGDMIFSVTQNGRNIEIVRELKMKKQLITPADYKAFRSLMVEWGDPNNRQLLFRVVHSK